MSRRAALGARRQRTRAHDLAAPRAGEAARHRWRDRFAADDKRARSADRFGAPGRAAGAPGAEGRGAAGASLGADGGAAGGAGASGRSSSSRVGSRLGRSITNSRVSRIVVSPATTPCARHAVAARANAEIDVVPPTCGHVALIGCVPPSSVIRPAPRHARLVPDAEHGGIACARLPPAPPGALASRKTSASRAAPSACTAADSVPSTYRYSKPALRRTQPSPRNV